MNNITDFEEFTQSLDSLAMHLYEGLSQDSTNLDKVLKSDMQLNDYLNLVRKAWTEIAVNLPKYEQNPELITAKFKHIDDIVSKIKEVMESTSVEGLAIGYLKKSLENHRLEEKNKTDELTGLQNYFKVQSNVEHLAAVTQRYGKKLSAVMIDIDHFKQFNDKYGHDCGDQVLQLVAKKIKENARVNVDIVTRKGGEEFLVVLPETDLVGAEVYAERVRQSIEDIKFNYNGKDLKVTASLGIAQYNHRIGDSKKGLDTLLKDSDKALYAAKLSGRNKVGKQTDKIKKVMTAIDYLVENVDTIAKREISTKSSYSKVKPKERTGGDFILIEEDERYIKGCIVDIAGKGIQVAPLVGAYAALHKILWNKSPAETNEIMNDLIDQLFSEMSYGTHAVQAVYVIDKKQGKITISTTENKGNYILRDKEVEKIESGGFPIALWKLGNQKYDEKTYVFNSGDVLLMVTDGFEDAYGGGSMGETNLIKQAKEDLNITPKQLVEKLYKNAPETKHPDDMSVTAIKYQK